MGQGGRAALPRILRGRLANFVSMTRFRTEPSRIGAYCAVLVLACAGAASGNATTLQDAVARAYASNPDFSEQRFRQRAVNEAYVQTRSQYGPTLSLGASTQYQYARLGGQGQSVDQGGLTLTLRQPIYTGGRLRGQVAAARADVEGSQQRLRQVEAEIVQAVIAAYAAVLRDEQRLDVGRENLLVLQSQLKEAAARRRVQDATVTDEAQAGARLAAAELQLASLEATLNVTRGVYVQIVGELPVDLQPLPELDGLPASFDQAVDLALLNNPEIAAARFDERSSSATVAAVRGERLPLVSLTAGAGASGPVSALERATIRTEVSTGLSVTQPIFASGAIRSRIRQAVTINQADQAAIDGARREALQDVVAAWSQLAAARTTLVAGLRQVELAQIAFAGMQRERRFGLRTTIEVLNAEQELQNAQLNLLQARYTEYVQRGALLLAMGMLRAQTIAPTLVAISPQAEFERVKNAGMTVLEPVVMALDRIGSARPEGPISPQLTGAQTPPPANAILLAPRPDARLTRGALVPITQSPVVPAQALPNGLPGSTAINGVVAEPRP